MKFNLYTIFLAAFIIGIPLFLHTPSLMAEGVNIGDEVRRETTNLLKELDGFKDSKIFKECHFGCGSKNPATIWDEKRKKLASYIKEYIQDVPFKLRSMPSELWMLAKSYAEDNKSDIKMFRNDIESSLKNK